MINFKRRSENMKLLNFIKEDQLQLGIKTNKGILDVAAAGRKLHERVPEDFQELIANQEVYLESLNRLVEKAQEDEADQSLFLAETNLEYAPPVANPEKIICVGLNYADHVTESRMDLPTTPVLFSKFNNTLNAHNASIEIPKVVQQCDYEAELVVVIGKEASEIAEEDALSYVFGYSIGNDLSARDLQMKTGQWLVGKSLDGFAPIGPYVVTADELDVSNLSVECKVNGEVRQSATTKDMIFSCAKLISYISHHMTLKPGDVIFSGTPEGVIYGYPEHQQQWLSPGDEMSVSIEGIGTLTNVLV
jgi:2-keto-4-pentenoate hydratase/2-oxohepta-3-ene-1,7-dioic acid hydratase in catechol pathway